MDILFKDWLSALILQEAKLTFGKYKGLDHTDPSVDIGWLRWAAENVSFLTPQQRKEFQAEIARRSAPPPPAPKPMPVASTPVVRSWVKANAISDAFGLKNGQLVALSKAPDGNWDYITLDAEKRKGVIPGPQVAKVAKSIRDAENNPIKINPDEFSVAPSVTESPESKYIFGPDKMPPGSEQEKIDKRFASLLANENQSHIMISALAGSGKAQPLDSMLLTTEGWVKMGDITTKHLVFGSDGLPHKILGIFPQGVKDIFEVKFTDGAIVKCCGDHLWTTETKMDKNRSCARTLTTKEIKDTLLYKGRPNHYIPLVKPLEFKKKETPIDPYLMGVLLGCAFSSTVDQEITEAVLGYNDDIKDWKKKKFVPDIFKYNDIETRLAILQGLLDTGGNINDRGVEFNTTSKQLANDVRFLVESFGGTTKISSRTTSFTYKGVRKLGRLSCRLNIKLPNDVSPFRLSRKATIYKPKVKYFAKRAITAIREAGKEICQCIAIDSPDNLYVTDSCVLTHNTSLLQHLAWKFGKPGQKWLYLVFNTKNRVEAEEKFPIAKKGGWVDVHTTNSFLGQLLGSAKNIERIPQTERMVRLQAQSKEEGSKNLEKARIIVDSPEFARLIEKAGIPDPKAAASSGEDQYQKRALESIFGSIRYTFKESTLTLLGLLKSFAATPGNSNSKVSEIMDKYDLDTDMEEVKERIQKYSPSFGTPIKRHMKSILGYDFMSKSYKEEIKEAALWMLNETLPHNTNQKFRIGKDEYELGQFRDFNDDLWYVALHADELHWPHYDVVLADEVQDFNEAQKMVMKKLHDAGAKIVAVGDKNQCHPPGTMIALAGGGEKPIEELEVGDVLVSYDSAEDVFAETKVLEINRRPYSGEMITIQAGAFSFDCTPNHRCLIKDGNETYMIEAGNIISGKMKSLNGWENITISRRNVNCDVYSLSVEPIGDNKLYLSNGIVVGNSLYRFRGADGDAFDNLGAMLKDLSADKDVLHTLSKNFRSKKNIIDFSNKETHVRNLLTGRKTTPGDDGIVSNGELNYNQTFAILENEKKAGKIKETAFISRTNEPLVHAALRLLGSGIPFVIVGKDVAQDLVKHIGKIMKMSRINESAPVSQLRTELEKHLESEFEKYSTHSTKKNYLKELDEVSTALISAIDQFDPDGDPENPGGYRRKTAEKRVSEFKIWLKSKLGGLDIQENEADYLRYKEKMEKEKPVILTTAHKSKGLEFERVYILRYDQFPHPKAKRAEDKLQEENGKYVAITRGRDEVHILQKKGQPGVRDD